MGKAFISKKLSNALLFLKASGKMERLMDFVEPFAMKKAAKNYILTLAITQITYLMVFLVAKLLVS